MNRTFQIRHLELKNRICVPPMVCFNWTDEEGFVTEKNVNHYKSLAEGGAGLIIVEATAITKRSKLHQTQLGLWCDEQVEGMKQIVDVIHAGGAKAFIQLNHAGGNGIDLDAEAPSTQAYRGGSIQAHEMSVERIQDTIQDFVAAALRAEKAGFDGIELHGCHGYLISCFANSRKNTRTDAYGQDKMLLAKEVLTACRKACKKELIIGIRLGVFEPLLEDGLAHAKELAPYTDFLDMSYGSDYDPCKPEDFPCSAAVYGAMKVKELLPDMPVFGVDQINSREDVINALATGIDLADVARAHLVDYSFANHVLQGEPEGHCLHCKGYCRWRGDNMKDPNAVCPGKVQLQKRQSL